jgi:hypothetical protein
VFFIVLVCPHLRLIFTGWDTGAEKNDDGDRAGTLTQTLSSTPLKDKKVTAETVNLPRVRVSESGVSLLFIAL